jgi:hypothetical protein
VPCELSSPPASLFDMDNVEPLWLTVIPLSLDFTLCVSMTRLATARKPALRNRVTEPPYTLPL